MGRSQSKILSSFGLCKSQEPADPAGRAFFTVRSGSLDSISTSVSLATQQSGPAHSSSLDNLYGSSRPRVEDRRRYVLLETGSVSSSRTADVDEQRGSESTLTRSLPAAMDRSVQCSSPRASGRVENTLDPDGFSDNFVTADDEGEARLTPRKAAAVRPSGGNSSSQPNLSHSGVGKSSLKKTQLTKEKVESKNRSSFPEIHVPAGLLKLSPDELKELVTYTAVTLQQSLQEKLVDTHQRLLDNRGQPGSREQDSPPATSTAKHVRINEGHHRQVRQPAERGDCLECRQVRNRRKPRKERPTSMPPIYVRDRGTCDDSPIDAAGDHGSSDPPRTGSQREECRYRGTESTQTMPDCSHDCRQTYEARPPHRRCHCECSGSGRGRKKRATRARASREYDPDTVGDSHVDTSIDDNCPGLPENRIRRRQHRHHTYRHSHSMCERCLEAGDEKHACRQRHRHRLPDEELDATFRDGDDAGFVTLDQLKTAGLLMKKSSGYASGGSADDPSPLRHSESFSQPRNHKPRVKPARQGSFRLEEVPTQSIHVSNFKELIYPVRSRTGRDSPATDMAVANLDLNSSEMLVPLQGRDGRKGNPESHQIQSFTSPDMTLNNNPCTSNIADGGAVRHTYLHNHHHFHHIIHHSQS